MHFKTAIAAGALGVTMLPASTILLDNLAGATELQQVRRVCGSHRCRWKPGHRVYFVERRYYPLWIDAGAYDAEFARAYWRGRAESPYTMVLVKREGIGAVSSASSGRLARPIWS